MQDLINRVVQNVGIDAGVAQPAIEENLPDGLI